MDRVNHTCNCKPANYSFKTIFAIGISNYFPLVMALNYTLLKVLKWLLAKKIEPNTFSYLEMDRVNHTCNCKPANYSFKTIFAFGFSIYFPLVMALNYTLLNLLKWLSANYSFETIFAIGISIYFPLVMALNYTLLKVLKWLLAKKIEPNTKELQSNSQLISPNLHPYDYSFYDCQLTNTDMGDTKPKVKHEKAQSESGFCSERNRMPETLHPDVQIIIPCLQEQQQVFFSRFAQMVGMNTATGTTYIHHFRVC